MIKRAADVADKLLAVLAHHVLPIFLAGKRRQDNVNTEHHLPVWANVNHVVVGSTLFTILNKPTQVRISLYVEYEITCITPYSFIGFTPYSLVCLSGHVLLPWIFDLEKNCGWVLKHIVKSLGGKVLKQGGKTYLHQKQGFCASSFSIRQKPSSKGVDDEGTIPLCMT